jgi:hypothetical protein
VAKRSSAIDRFTWMEAVLKSEEFTDAEARVLIRLALHQNIKSGRLDVGIDKLAKGANQRPRKATGTVGKAEKLGWITRAVGGGRNNTTSYGLICREPETLHAGAGFSAVETLHAGPARPGQKPYTGRSETLHGRAPEHKEQESDPVSDRGAS